MVRSILAVATGYEAAFSVYCTVLYSGGVVRFSVDTVAVGIPDPVLGAADGTVVAVLEA
jgi:hypothetical protein